ncbi:sodium/bile acid cotransporter 7-B isoform X2 [Aplysia californica]|uniref:Sodium/bile acid cotransporter 7-B isoform X2 n=1 Tax=Aplysia californica TaxID=6500 RepID=A0ABM1AAK0_APLCA|nr:sodium/bile acid cotransporter 7-B isoform X2 [Aplysia californica]
MKNNHFCCGILIVILFAKLFPSIGNAGGILKPEITVKYIAVSVIFLNSGLTLPTEELKTAIFQWQLHLLVQGFTFVVFPLIVYGLVSVLQYTFLHPALLEGMTILSTMPPPVSSAIILTKSVGGNEAAAVFNSAFGSMLGIFVTPSLILLLLGSSNVQVPTQKIFQQLFTTVVLPLIIGQIIRNSQYRWLQRQRIPFRTIGHVLILFIIYTTFCATFSRTDIQMDTLSLLSTIVLIFCLQLSFMCFLLLFSSHSMFSFTSNDSVTITYCGTHKSLTLGIPVIEIIFEGDPNISFLSVPLLVYNPMQIVLGGMSISLFRQWLIDQKTKRRRRSG